MTKGNNIILSGGEKKYAIITFLKGYSIMTIVLMHLIQAFMHCPNIINKAATIGGSGVHIFFLCSGFGLYLSYLKKPVKYFEFLKARFLKVYIPYIIVVIISACIPFMFSGNKIKALLSHVLLYKMFVPEYESSFGGQLWFVSTIIQFYLLFIPICKIKKKINRGLFIKCAVAISIGWWIFTALTGLCEERIWGSFFLQYLWEFAIGMIVAENLYKGQDIILKKSSLILYAIAGIGIATIMAQLGGVFKAFNDFFSMIGYGSLAVFIYSLSIGWFNKIVLFISTISYEIYLLHILVFTVLFRYLVDVINSEIIIGSIAIVVTLVISYGYNSLCNIVKNTITNKIGSTDK